MVNATIPALPDSCFYFVDTPRALRARDGRKAKELNGKRKRCRTGQRGRRCNCQRIPLAPAERIAALRWFYAEAAAEGAELSPFDA
jgi:hypothetical protein